MRSLKKCFIIYISLLLCITAMIVFPACNGIKTGYSLPETEKPLPQAPRSMLADSNVYTNEEYGFSLHYTDDFEVNEGAPGKVFVFIGPRIEQMTYAINIYMRAEEKGNRLTLADYAGSTKEAAARDLRNFTQLDEYVTTVAGETAVVLVDRYNDNHNGREIEFQDMIVYFIKDDMCYAMKFGSNSEEFDGYIDTFYMALNTLTFSD